jgi:hypothetical protein
MLWTADLLVTRPLLMFQTSDLYGNEVSVDVMDC